MTREEAIEIFRRPRSVHGDIEVDWIDRFVDLGMLKLSDRPLPATELEAVRAALEEAAGRLEKYSTNRLYHKALIRGAKIIRELMHEYEMQEFARIVK